MILSLQNNYISLFKYVVCMITCSGRKVWNDKYQALNINNLVKVLGKCRKEDRKVKECGSKKPTKF